MQFPSYGFGTSVPGTLEAVRPRVVAALQAQGFGILTEIDVAAVFKKKLDLDHRPYVILGACNPTLASAAIAGDPWIGLLLPCNVVLQQSEDGTRTEVGFADPGAMFQMVDADGLNEVAEQAATRLRSALSALS